jgi:hypothetical protein
MSVTFILEPLLYLVFNYGFYPGLASVVYRFHMIHATILTMRPFFFPFMIDPLRLYRLQ